jgi:hypothetical protein
VGWYRSREAAGGEIPVTRITGAGDCRLLAILACQRPAQSLILKLHIGGVSDD